MATLASLVVQLEANSAQLVQGINRANRTMDTFGATARRVGAAVAGIFAAGQLVNGIRRFGSFILDTNREFQRLNAQLITVTGSAGVAAQAFKELETFARETPFTLDKSVTAFIRLQAQGVRPTVEELRALGDVGAALNRDIEQVAAGVIGAVTGATERLTEMGIVTRLVGNQVLLSFRGQTVAVERNAAAVVTALTNISKANFAGAMAERMKTLDGQISNIQDGMAEFARAIGATVVPIVSEFLGFVQGLVTELNNNSAAVQTSIRWVMALAVAIGSPLKNAFEIAGGIVGNFGAMVWGAVQSLQGLVTFDWRKAQEGYRLLSTAALDMGQTVLDNTRDVLNTWATLRDTLQTPLPDVAAIVPIAPVSTETIETYGMASTRFNEAAEGLENFRAVADAAGNNTATLSRSMRDMARAGQQSVAGAADRITADMERIREEIEGTMVPSLDEITAAMRQKGREMQQVAYQIGQGVIRGLIGGSESLVDTLKNVMRSIAEQAITNELKNVLGIASPSRVTMEMGRQTVAGFVEGLRQRAGAVQSMMGATFTPAMAGGGIPMAAGGGGATYHVTVHHAPVVNAIDGRGMREALLENNSSVAEAVHEALKTAGPAARANFGRTR